MGAGELLRRLDRAVLPPLGHVLSWFLLGVVRRRLVVTAGVLVTTGLLLASVWAAHEPPATYRHAGPVIRVGVSEGQSLSSYTEQARRELRAMAGRGVVDSYALVSFDAYLSPDRAGMLVPGVRVHRAYTRAQVSDGRADVVEITVDRMPDDLRIGMRRVATQREAQEQSYLRDAAKLTGSSEAEREHRRSYLRKAAAAAAEAAAYRSMCSCVYALVVRGTAGALDRLARRGGVRAVDPAPELSGLDRAVFVPPLPEHPDDPGAPSSPAPSGYPAPTGLPTPSRSPTASAPPSTSPAPSRSGSVTRGPLPSGGGGSSARGTTYGGEADE